MINIHKTNFPLWNRRSVAIEKILVSFLKVVCSLDFLNDLATYIVYPHIIYTIF
jgi:hypothetical protein